MDLSTFTTAELKVFLAEIPAELKRREKDEKARIRKEIEALASRSGYSLDELLGEAKAQFKQVKKVAPKYQHPTDSSLTWTGRGRQPKWLREFVEGGGSLEALVI